MDKLTWKVSVMAGEAAIPLHVKGQIQMAMAGRLTALISANAFNKEAINMAGHHYSGHTEVYAGYDREPKIYHDAGP